MLDISLLIRDLVLFLGIALIVILITRKLALPYTLGLVIVGLFIGFIGLTPEAQLSPELVLFVFLPALLFEGAFSTRFALLRENWRVIFFLAGPGLLLSLLIIALMLHLLDQLDWMTALLLAAILSPTDPVAVLGLFRQMHVNERLSSIIEGESLFNDGVAGSLYQTFLALVLLTVHGQAPGGWVSFWNGISLFLLEAGGGIVLGLACGWVISQGLKRLDDPVLETTITLITAYGIYWLADTLHLSAIMAVIVSALILGNYGRRIGMSERTRSDVDTFWRMLAFLANALIFLLIGVQFHPFARLLFVGTGFTTWLVALSAIGVVLLSRFVLVLILTLRAWLTLSGRARRATGELIKQPLPRAWQFLVFWSGLRGALSLALVLALPISVPAREILIISTFAVVFFTLLVQGLSLRWVLHRVLSSPSRKVAPPSTPPEEAVIEEPAPQETA
jgi:CPA1 family monovalent cation:H+ antiporter